MDKDRTIRIGDIGGISEAADIVGVSVSRIHQLLTEDAGFPRPIWFLKVGRIWDMTEVAEWRDNRNSYRADIYHASRIRREQGLGDLPVTPKPDPVEPVAVLSPEERAERLAKLFGHSS